MTKRIRTTLTVQVRLPIPPAANTAMVLEFIREALRFHKDRAVAGKIEGQSPTTYPMRGLDVNEMVVKLERKDTVYL